MFSVIVGSINVFQNLSILMCLLSLPLTSNLNSLSMPKKIHPPKGHTQALHRFPFTHYYMQFINHN